MSEEREYILRIGDESGGDRYVPVTEFNIQQYSCGLRAGDLVRLRNDLPRLDEDGNPTGKVYAAGEVWRVLSGAEADPTALWLRQADGQLHAWDDDPSIFETFERIAPNEDGATADDG